MAIQLGTPASVLSSKVNDFPSYQEVLGLSWTNVVQMF